MFGVSVLFLYYVFELLLNKVIEERSRAAGLVSRTAPAGAGASAGSAPATQRFWARSWFMSPKKQMALSGRNPEANVDHPANHPDRTRQPHPIYGVVFDDRLRPWPPFLRHGDGLVPAVVNSLAANEASPRHASRLTRNHLAALHGEASFDGLLGELVRASLVASLPVRRPRFQTSRPASLWSVQE